MTGNTVTIARVELTGNARAAWRLLHNEDSHTCPVLLWLSRELDDFEVFALRETAGLLTLEGHPDKIVIPGTALEAVRHNIPEWNTRIAGAVEYAAKLRADTHAARSGNQ
jgi:hypothetical protein